MEPATTLIQKLGGLTAVANVTGVDVHTVKRWRQNKDQGGTDGRIPRKHIFSLHKHCLQNQVSRSLESLLFTPDEIEELQLLQDEVKQKDEISSSPNDEQIWGCLNEAT